MCRLVFFLSFLLISSVFAQKEIGEIRILNLLPHLRHPPLVEPYLPSDFSLGKQENDPYFSKGYHWGNRKTLDDYFEDRSNLKGCLIWAQLSPSVRQKGHDRFSNDGHTQDLTAAGFTEIKVNKGKWGIFPYRELLAVGPKGRRYFQMWVGLNTAEGAALHFQFIYPEYLREPTRMQKSIWENFVKKTHLMCLNDLMVANARVVIPNFSAEEDFKKKIGLRVEKRRRDQKLLIQAENAQNFSILKVKENHFPVSLVCRPYIEIETLLSMNGEEKIKKKIRVFYQTVDTFSFSLKMLQINRFSENGHVLFFH